MTDYIAVDTYAGYALDVYDRLYVPEDVEIITSIKSAIASDEADGRRILVAIDGTVVSFDELAIQLWGDSTGVGEQVLTIGETGVVRTISGDWAAISMDGSGSVFQNWGEVTGMAGAVFGDFDSGVIENHGVISGTFEVGISVAYSSGVQVANTGLISGDDGVVLWETSGKVVNTGQILATSATGHAIRVINGDMAVEIVNEGVLRAPYVAVSCSVAPDSLLNRGLILGDVELGGGADLYDGRFGQIDGIVKGEDGNDALRGGDAGDVMSGDDGSDLLVGRRGDDELHGGADADTIRGGRGDDWISGGTGVDWMKGGRDDDTFHFGAIDHMTSTGAKDRIVDFGSGQDVIDLSDLVDGPLLFMGEDAFAGGGQASVKVRLKSDNSLVKVDIDGDGVLDGQFLVAGVTGLDADDFLL